MPTDLTFKTFDADGQPATTKYFLDGDISDVEDGGVAAIQLALDALTDSAIATVGLAVHDNALVGAAGANPYGIEDKAVVCWRDTAGQSGGFAIPCPDESIFGPNGEDVDLTTGVGATAKAAIEALVKGPSGAAVTVLTIQRWRFTRQP